MASPLTRGLGQVSLKKLLCRDVVTELREVPGLCKLSWMSDTGRVDVGVCCSKTGGEWARATLLEGHNLIHQEGWEEYLWMWGRESRQEIEGPRRREASSIWPDRPMGTHRGGPGSYGDQTFEVRATRFITHRFWCQSRVHAYASH